MADRLAVDGDVRRHAPFVKALLDFNVRHATVWRCEDGVDIIQTVWYGAVVFMPVMDQGSVVGNEVDGNQQVDGVV